MPDAMTVEIADDVVARLNVPSAFSQVIAAERAWTVLYELEELADLKVTVVASTAITAEDATRDERAVSHEIQVGIQKRIHAQTVAETNTLCDPLAYLAQEIGDHFVSEDVMESMSAGVGAQCVSSSAVLCDPQMLREKRVFLAIVTLDFLEWRAR